MMADKTIKTVLNMASLSAIRRKNELSDYYNRKVADGKNKMSVINAVRNKIIHRVFAVIKNQTLYQKDLVLPSGQTHHKKSATNQPQITRFFTNLPIDQFIRSQKINGKRIKFVEISVIRG
jgi:hypothetical protein